MSIAHKLAVKFGDNSIYRPGEAVTLEDNFSGAVVCDVLVVPAGLTLSGNVQAREIYIHGFVNGNVDCATFTLGDNGVFLGSVVASNRINISGRLDGLSIANALFARGDAFIEGDIVVNTLERQRSTTVVARVFAGPGMRNNDEVLRSSRLRFEKRRQLTSSSSGIVVDIPREDNKNFNTASSGEVIPYLIK